MSIIEKLGISRNWRYSEVFDIITNAPVGITGSNYDICSMDSHSESYELNKTLIASSPSMLEALIESRYMICGLCVRLNPQHKDCNFCQDVSIIDDSIKDATNKSWEEIKELIEE